MARNMRSLIAITLCGFVLAALAQDVAFTEDVATHSAAEDAVEDTSVPEDATMVDAAAAAPPVTPGSRLSVRWRSSGGNPSATIPVSSILASINPTVPDGLASACRAAGGSVRNAVSPDVRRTSTSRFGDGYTVTASATEWTYRLNSRFATPKPGSVKVPYTLTTSCTSSGVSPVTSRGLVTLDIQVDSCGKCLTSCTASNKPGKNGTCAVFAGHCPTTWPDPSAFKGVGWSLSMHFVPSPGQKLCDDPAFGGFPLQVGSQVDSMVRAMYLVTGRLAKDRYGPDPPVTTQPASIKPVCREPSQLGQPWGVVQVFVDTMTSKPGANDVLHSDMEKYWNMRNACPTSFPSSMDQGVINVLTAFCTRMGAPAAPITWAGVCVMNADPNLHYRVDDPVEKACFPGDATLTIADPATGAPLRAARMDEIRIGDAVECLAPRGMGAGAGSYYDAAQTYERTVCRVFGYHDVDADVKQSYVALHYKDASGRRARLRASKEHLVFVHSSAISASDRASEVKPGGAAKRADMVEVGDLLVVKAEDGSFYTARVNKIKREQHKGAYAPLLTKAGLPIVDGAAAFSWAHLPEHAPHPAQNLGEFYRHVRLVRDFEDSLASGCAGDACPCLDAPADAARRCVRLGHRLSSLPAGVSDFAGRTIEVWSKAASEGRTFWDYESGIVIAKAWEASKVIQWVERSALHLRPHTAGVALTNWFMRRPTAASVYPPAAARGSAMQLPQAS